MKKTTLIHLEADENKYLTDGNRYVKFIDIGPGQSEDTWREITKSEYERCIAQMTPREFILALLNKGITREQIETLISNNDIVWAELNYATYIERKNPLLDALCSQFGLTPKDIDDIFGLNNDEVSVD